MKMKNAILTIILITGILLSACPISDSDKGGGLSAPTSISAGASSSTSIILNWTAVSGAAKYKIYRSGTSTGIYQYVDETDSTNYLISNLSPETTYYFKVSSVDIKGIESPQSMYVQGTTLPPPIYLVSFDANGGIGTPPSTQPANAGSSITLPDESGMSKNGFTFGGWNSIADGTGIPYSAGSFYTVLNNITLFAVWNNDSNPPIYTVTFNANGGGGTPPASVSQNAGYTFTLPSGNELSRSGYTFDGWCINSTGIGTAYSAGSSYTVSGNITLYAKWNEESGNGGGEDTETIHPPGFTLTDKFNWLQGNAQSGGHYTIVVSSNVSLPPQSLSYIGQNNITIRLTGGGPNITVSLSSGGAMFTIGIGVTLVLDNITLRGHTSWGSNSLVEVNNVGTLIMNAGSVITGNRKSSSSAHGGGVYVKENGIFIMNGGTISGNTIVTRWDFAHGGGVSVVGGTFTMNNGIISNNSVEDDSWYYNVHTYGGGVYVNNGIFTMNGGIISGNTAHNRISHGGGVSVGPNGIFNMINGSIFGNTASSSSSSFVSYGGGVHVSGTFNMSGGTISGNNVTSTSTDFFGGGLYVNGNFTKTGGTIFGFSLGDSNNNVASSGTTSYRGHAVYAFHSSTIWKGKDTTVGPTANLSFNGNTGDFSGVWDF